MQKDILWWMRMIDDMTLCHLIFSENDFWFLNYTSVTWTRSWRHLLSSFLKCLNWSKFQVHAMYGNRDLREGELYCTLLYKPICTNSFIWEVSQYFKFVLWSFIFYSFLRETFLRNITRFWKVNFPVYKLFPFSI